MRDMNQNPFGIADYLCLAARLHIQWGVVASHAPAVLRQIFFILASLVGLIAFFQCFFDIPRLLFFPICIIAS